MHFTESGQAFDTLERLEDYRWFAIVGKGIKRSRTFSLPTSFPKRQYTKSHLSKGITYGTLAGSGLWTLGTLPKT